MYVHGIGKLPLFDNVPTFHGYLSNVPHFDIALFLPYLPLLVSNFLLHFDVIQLSHLFVLLVVQFGIFPPKINKEGGIILLK